MNHELAASIRESWRRGKPWVAIGILATLALVSLLLYTEYVGVHRGIAESKATGLGAVAGAWDPITMWQLRQTFARGSSARYAMAYYQRDDDSEDSSQRLIVRTGKMRIVVSRPSAAVDQIARLARDSRGFVANSAVAGEGNQQSAQVVVRVPAELFDEIRRQVLALAVEVEVDSVESRDVTREYTDQDATLRNLHATEQQYLALLRRAARMEDITAITGKLSEVRGQIDKMEADLRLLQSQVVMSSLTVDIDALAAAAPLAWKPLLRMRENWHSVASGFVDYSDSMIAFVMHIPILIVWITTVLLLVKVCWMLIKRLFRLLFPTMPTWPNRMRPAE